MSITIKIKEVVKDGEKYVKILELEALGINGCPEEYCGSFYSSSNSLDKYPYLILLDTTSRFHLQETSSKHYILKTGDVIPLKRFKEIEKLAERCGNRLQRINKKIRDKKLLETWNKERTIII